MSGNELGPNDIGPQQAIDFEKCSDVINELGIPNDVEARANQLLQIDGAGLFNTAQTLHAVLAPGFNHEPTDFPMKMTLPNGEVTKVLMRPEERAGLYETAANLIQELAKVKSTETNEAFLARSANVAGLAIVLAHPFEEGNGRTSRVISYLIREGFDGSEVATADIALVGANRPTEGFRINGTLPSKLGRDMSPSDLLAVAASTDIPLIDQASYVERKNDHFVSAWTD